MGAAAKTALVATLEAHKAYQQGAAAFVSGKPCPPSAPPTDKISWSMFLGWQHAFQNDIIKGARS